MSAPRLEDKVAIVVGAGQTPGETIGNGRATSVLFAREGASVLLVDRSEAAARETAEQIESEGGKCAVLAADVTDPDAGRAVTEACVQAFGRIDVLHNNVGIGTGDGSAIRVSVEAWDHIMDVNLKSAFLTCKHVLPVMREQGSGVITNISSVAAVCSTNIVAYKTSKAGLNAFTHAIALAHAKHGIRANAIMPGLMDTPMAIEGISRAVGISKDDLRTARDAAVPLGAKMGSAWDVAYASLFLASDEAKFITGVMLPVDGGQSAKIG
jgi:NAD(P)-dependent dehydrogenase (short-subunit alcohol dehydrogenase family)